MSRPALVGALVLTAVVLGPATAAAQGGNVSDRCQPVNPSPPDMSSHIVRHQTLEALARGLGYDGGRANPAESAGLAESRNIPAMTTQGDADFRCRLSRAGYELLDSIDDKNETGMQAMVVRDRRGQTTIVFRGTEPNKDWHGGLPLDVRADFEPHGNVGAMQYNRHLAQLDSWATLYPNSYVTGHSLGAALAERYISEHPETVTDAALFNVPGIASDLAQRAAKSPDLPPCTIYVAKGDPVSELGGLNHVPCRVIEVSNPDIKGIIQGYSPAAHSYTMLDSRNQLVELDFAQYEQRRRDTYQRVRAWIIENVRFGRTAVDFAPPAPNPATPEMIAAAQRQRQRPDPRPNRRYQTAEREPLHPPPAMGSAGPSPITNHSGTSDRPPAHHPASIAGTWYLQPDGTFAIQQSGATITWHLVIPSRGIEHLGHGTYANGVFNGDFSDIRNPGGNHDGKYTNWTLSADGTTICGNVSWWKHGGSSLHPGGGSDCYHRAPRR
jgi:pimeloyl-ACP methyl ester carboxylesterase